MSTPEGRHGAGPNQERATFHATLGYLFPDLSDGMIQKCWMRARELSNSHREKLIYDLASAAAGKLKAQKAKAT